MDSKEAREYVRTAGCECQGTTRKALDIVLSDSEKLERIERIVARWQVTQVIVSLICARLMEY